MPLVAFDTVNFLYPGVEILKNASLQIHRGNKIGLIGRNGCGKSTLFRLIMGQLTTDSGNIFRERGLKTMYLPQENSFPADSTAYKEMLKPFAGLIEMEGELKKLEEQLAHSATLDKKTSDRYSFLLEQIQRNSGYQYEQQIEAVLRGLQIPDRDFHKRMDEFSGGQKNRIALGQILLGQYDLLLLDEPTNHLDIFAIEWLENYLKNLDTALLIISHDRYFLNRVVNSIVELTDKNLHYFPGNYDFYLREKEERERFLQKQYELQNAEIRRQEEFIRRNMAGQNFKQAKSRIKKLEKVERIELAEQEKNIQIRLNDAQRSGKEVIRFENVSFGYGQAGRLFTDFSRTIYRGEKIGIIGPNGSGKTSILKVITGQVTPLSGKVEIGYNLDIGYFDQELAGLHGENTALDEIWNLAPDMSNTQVRSLLGSFLFCGQDAEKTISSLSGGEKKRLAIIKLILGNHNLLLLDEPTNHLDISSRSALEEALKNFNGTLILVSHDRALLDGIVENVLYISQGGIESFDGNYSYFWEKWQLRQSLQEKNKPEKVNVQKDAYARMKEDRRRQEKREREIKMWEEKISITEQKIQELDKEISLTPGNDWVRINELTAAKDNLNQELELCLEKWEIAHQDPL